MGKCADFEVVNKMTKSTFVRELPKPTAPPMQQSPAQDAQSVERHARIADKPMSYEDMLNESNFHDIANDDEKMYRQIHDIPDDDPHMTNAVTTIVQRHVPEIWSPARATAFAHEFKLVPGFAQTSRSMTPVACHRISIFQNNATNSQIHQRHAPTKAELCGLQSNVHIVFNDARVESSKDERHQVPGSVRRKR